LSAVLRALATAAIALSFLGAGCGDDDDEATDRPEAARSSSEGGCRDVQAPAAKPDGGERKPKRKLDPGAEYEVTFETSCGAFVIALDQETSPNTAASFAALVEKGFYDGLSFHRIVPGFVIQGGDPTGSGGGGPGYSTRDVPPANARYVRGVVAMAKTPTEPPGTAGSQFYVVSGADAGLPPEYALLGRVTDGLDVVQRIDALGDPASGEAGTPLRPVVIEKATLKAR
jgi:cyclophilin family peptidyl-prolyl cis-trans isomerase